jgi:hypothetical protein
MRERVMTASRAGARNEQRAWSPRASSPEDGLGAVAPVRPGVCVAAARIMRECHGLKFHLMLKKTT